MVREVVAPILVVGTHRSGTTLLGRALARHPQVAYWEEPRHVWSWGHNFRSDDLLVAADATPRIRRRIRRRFARFLESAGRPRLAEKTPSNCLRLEFVHRIFPDALFIHIHRDGRAVVHSTDVMIRTRGPGSRWWGQRLLGTPPWEWPALLPRAARTLGRRLLGREMAYWGPQPPGWRDWLRRDPRFVMLAKQWRYTLEPVLEFGRRLPPERWLDIGYEQLVTAPGPAARRIQEFAGLAESAEFVDHLQRECRSDRIDAWRSQLDDGLLASMRAVLEPPLDRLGYEW